MGASSSKVSNSANEEPFSSIIWNPTTDVVEQWKRDILTLANVIKFLVKVVKDHNELNARVNAGVMAARKQGIWACVENTVKVKGIESLPTDLIKEAAKMLHKTIVQMAHAVAQSVHATKEWLTKTIVAMKVDDVHLDSPSRQAIEEKATKAYAACSDLQKLCGDICKQERICWGSFRKRHEYYRNDLSEHIFLQVPTPDIHTHTIIIQCAPYLLFRCDNNDSCCYEAEEYYGHSDYLYQPRFLLEISYSTLTGVSCSYGIIMEIEDTDSFVEVTHTNWCAQLSQAVSNVKGMIVEIENDLNTPR
jgi:hypothetical protein